MILTYSILAGVVLLGMYTLGYGVGYRSATKAERDRDILHRSLAATKRAHDRRESDALNPSAVIARKVANEGRARRAKGGRGEGIVP